MSTKILALVRHLNFFEFPPKIREKNNSKDCWTFFIHQAPRTQTQTGVLRISTSPRNQQLSECSVSRNIIFLSQNCFVLNLAFPMLSINNWNKNIFKFLSQNCLVLNLAFPMLSINNWNKNIFKLKNFKKSKKFNLYSSGTQNTNTNRRSSNFIVSDFLLIKSAMAAGVHLGELLK